MADLVKLLEHTIRDPASSLPQSENKRHHLSVLHTQTPQQQVEIIANTSDSRRLHPNRHMDDVSRLSATNDRTLTNTPPPQPRSQHRPRSLQRRPHVRPPPLVEIPNPSSRLRLQLTRSRPQLPLQRRFQHPCSEPARSHPSLRRQRRRRFRT
jgi:hypothetical protein